jgi:hypothetical protein
VKEIQLAFKAFDVHELGCHFVARHAGLYARHNLAPRLLDATFVPDDELPPGSFQAACGSALAAWLGGADRRVVFIAAERPMFWLYAGPDIGSVPDLADRLIAGYPAAAPPAAFLRDVLVRRGLPAERLRVVASRDDEARVGLLRDGSAAAALVSSAVPPARMSGAGFQPLVFLGDELSVATTGLAVAPALCASDPELVAAVCACYREALALIHHDAAVLAGALAEALVAAGRDAVSLAAVLRHCYTRRGQCPMERLQGGAERLAVALGLGPARSVAGLYDFSFLDVSR